MIFRTHAFSIVVPVFWYIIPPKVWLALIAQKALKTCFSRDVARKISKSTMLVNIVFISRFVLFFQKRFLLHCIFYIFIGFFFLFFLRLKNVRLKTEYLLRGNIALIPTHWIASCLEHAHAHILN